MLPVMLSTVKFFQVRIKFDILKNSMPQSFLSELLLSLLLL